MHCMLLKYLVAQEDFDSLFPWKQNQAKVTWDALYFTWKLKENHHNYKIKIKITYTVCSEHTDKFSKFNYITSDIEMYEEMI